MRKRQLGPCVTFFPQPTTILTTVAADGEVNLMTASWAGIVSKTPPTMAVSLNKGRKSYANILRNRQFVVNMAPASLMIEADYCGIRSGHQEDKLDGSGLILEPSEKLAVPMLAAAPLNLECRLVNEVELGDYRLLLGEILQVHAVERAFAEDGSIDTREFDPLVYLGGIREYWDLGRRRGKAYQVGKRLLRNGGDGNDVV